MKPTTESTLNSQISLIHPSLWQALTDKTQSTLSGGGRGYRFPCDGPGRGGTCDISAWDY